MTRSCGGSADSDDAAGRGRQVAGRRGALRRSKGAPPRAVRAARAAWWIRGFARAFPLRGRSPGCHRSIPALLAATVNCTFVTGENCAVIVGR